MPDRRPLAGADVTQDTLSRSFSSERFVSKTHRNRGGLAKGQIPTTIRRIPSEFISMSGVSLKRRCDRAINGSPRRSRS